MMFFYLLTLAHLVGDFPLQTDAVYRVKQKSYWGVLLHVAICTIVNIIILFPFVTSIFTWVAILFLASFHFVLDRMKMLATLLQEKDGLGYFYLDQLLHFYSLFMAAVWLERLYVGPSLEPVQITRIIQLNGLVAAAFAIPPILFYIQRHVKNHLRLENHFDFPTAQERLPGSVARFIGTYGIIQGGWYNLLIVAALIIPWIYPQNKSRPLAYTRTEMIVNFSACLLAGFLVIWLI